MGEKPSGFEGDVINGQLPFSPRTEDKIGIGNRERIYHSGLISQEETSCVSTHVRTKMIRAVYFGSSFLFVLEF